MKNPDRDTVSRLEALPNIGTSITADLQLIGIHHPKSLIGMDPYNMYEKLCEKTGKRHDPCVQEVKNALIVYDQFHRWKPHKEEYYQVLQESTRQSDSSPLHCLYATDDFENYDNFGPPKSPSKLSPRSRNCWQRFKVK